MLSLFDTGKEQAGYRLKTLELFNWGTFHEGSSGQDIWRVGPDAQNSLLTGANGSGKTTLVDGLLALLVSPKKRFFNQSSGAQSTKERTEESYVEGHYGRTQGEEQAHSRVEKLRQRGTTYSVVLGVFVNEQASPVTLAQVRWFSQRQLQRWFLVARQELSIAEHIRFDSGGQWLRQLKNQPAGKSLEVFDGFSRYAERFRQLFGMRSEKALTLFNQTVGMKVLGNLDEFIRANMLEDNTAEAAFDKLLTSYQTLLASYQALEKARTQLDLLQPIHDLSRSYDDLEQQLEHARYQQQWLPAWWAREQVSIWTAELARQDEELDRLQRELAQHENAWDTTNAQHLDLERQWAANDTLRLIQDLTRDIDAAEKEKAGKERKLQDYNALSRQLALPTDPDEAIFRQSLAQLRSLRAATEQDLEDVKEQQMQGRIRQQQLQAEYDHLLAEIEQLRGSAGKITGRVAEIRQELLQAVRATEAQIPFAAEVMQVRAEDKDRWNDAVEKKLHSFGLSLLVPPALYSAVNAYVHAQRNLRGKIVYHQVDTTAFRLPPADERMLVARLEFNPQSPYADWVEQHIASRFDYVCVTEQAAFERLGKALLPSGLSRNKNRHERDDTQHRHILGWDNRELRRELEGRARAVSAEIDQITQQLIQLGKQLKQLEQRQQQLERLTEFRDFAELDWQAVVLRVETLLTRKRELEDANAPLRVMAQQLTEVKVELEKLNELRKNTNQKIGETEAGLKLLRAERKKQQEQLEIYDEPALMAALAALQELTAPLTGQVTYLTFDAQKHQLGTDLTARLTALQQENSQVARQLQRRMDAFLRPGKAVTEKFADWGSDLHEWTNELSRRSDYLALCEQLREEQLAALELRFREEFKRGVTNALTDYCGALEQQHEHICETIEQINQSLRDITFNLAPDTYIQLERTNTRRPRVHEFRFTDMPSWQPDRTQLALAPDPKQAEIDHFVQHIQPFIRRLQENEKWRQEVTDVRNWSDFKAREYYKAENKPFRVYENSGSLSGGEAAQLAYTVLGAAIAYQFGMNQATNPWKSFRFIVVDEAFSKLDEDKSKYLLQLCRSLGLQLMVVTPLTSIHLVEKDVSVIHWVTKAKHHKDCSVVRDIPILEYHQKKGLLLAAEAELES
ncbi:ATP-binding protein [Hymenobacter sp. CRA2]|uniref:ATP-binding protein n=1 Tax=Hymenobacter sp. CRA2 TaxID=1955620 RepID=UPI00098FCCE0|nr:SbcC/MukB-like Walker B domain-containing protein [Hymenobacter sp. CRA2]OON65479.1 hypothetical protein B0919_24175 [Hymenobacter sp. CRA2]